MRVERKKDGSITFLGSGQVIEIDAQRRSVVQRRRAAPPAVLSFSQITQVGSCGPASAELSLYLQLSDGRTLALGLAPTLDLARDVTTAVSEVIGCALGCPVRVAGSGGTKAHGETIVRFDDSHPRIKASEAATLEVEVEDILGIRSDRWPAVIPRPHSGDQELTSPTATAHDLFQDEEKTQPDIMSGFETAAADLLALYETSA